MVWILMLKSYLLLPETALPAFISVSHVIETAMVATLGELMPPHIFMAS